MDPIVVAPISDQTATEGSVFSFVVPPGTFADPDAGDTLSYSARLANGAALPAWLSFNAATRTFSGTPPTTAAGLLDLRVTVTDSTGGSTNDIFALDIANRVTGTNSANNLSGTAGRDYIEGLNGNDTLNGLAGADTLVGGAGDDTYVVDNAGDVVIEAAGGGTDTVQSSISYALTDNVERLTLTGSANIDGSGNALNNQITGNSGNNVLDGGAGADAMTGGAGNDTYVVDNAGDTVTEGNNGGTDTVQSSINYTLGNNLEHLVLTGSANVNGTGNTLANSLTGNSGNNRLNGGTGADTMAGGAGNDTYVVDNVGDVIVEAEGGGIDTVETNRTTTLAANLENLTLTGNGDLDGTGNASNNLITGNAGDNVLTGGAGNDTLVGNGGEDQLIGGTGNDTYVLSTGGGGGGDDDDDDDDSEVEIVEQADGGTDTVQTDTDYVLAANLENLVLTGTDNIDGTGNALNNEITGNSGNNVLIGGAGGDYLDGGLGRDTMIGGQDSDAYEVDNVGDVIIEQANQGLDTVLSSISYTLGANSNLEGIQLRGTANLNATGNALDNKLTGNAGNNVLTGGAGNDYLEGMGGADTMIGGTGDDIFVVDNVGDVVTELAGQGTDTVYSNINYTLGATLENLSLNGVNIKGTGNALNNVLTGYFGDDTLDGGLGADTMIGSSGNDTYVVDNVGDVVTELASEGSDSVVSSISYVLGNSLENLTLTGAANLNGTGNGLRNYLVGNSGANVLDGGFAEDLLQGGQGDDTYLVDDTGDLVVEAAGEGVDSIVSSVSYTLGDNVENLTLTGTTNRSLTGNALNNVLTGNSGNNAINGGAGADTMIGGAGDDSYVVDNAGDVIVEATGQGNDSVASNVSYTLGAGIENLDLTGSAAINATGNDLANLLEGNGAANVLDGGAGADTMVGGAGADTYVVNDAGDVVVEVAGGGHDTVLSSISYVLGTSQEDLTLTGSADINGSGNEQENVLVGNAGNNVLDGGADGDTMTGGAGDDTYIVDSSDDAVIEAAGEGNDSIVTTVSMTLVANVENLTAGGTGNRTLIGNELNNVLTGNTGNNTLNGAAGADTMVGGRGDDNYFVDDAGDVVTELANQGNDTVNSSVSWTLGTSQDNLVLSGGADLTGNGNQLDNRMTGNAGNNVLNGATGNDTLDGGAGADTLVGGEGDDTYVVDNAGDVVTELSGEGSDTVLSSVNWTLGTSQDKLTLTDGADLSGTGNGLDNVLIGNSGNNALSAGSGDDRLDGGAGADTMTGGTGADTYVVDNAGDVVVELAGGGHDIVEASVSYTLGTAQEDLVLTGSADINGTGNEAENVLTGNSGNNILDGGTNDDVMQGGAGDDTYLVDNVGDVVVEAAGEGVDTVVTSVSYALAANVENIVTNGTGNRTLTGNDLDNRITGNVGNNTLIGNAGNDTFVGNAGADTVNGGTGNDTYVFGRGDGADSVTDTDSTAGNTDVASFLPGIAYDQLWFRHVGNNLEVSIIGTSDRMTVQNWYSGEDNHIEEFHTSDGRTLTDNNVQALVDAMAGFAPPASGQTTLPPDYQSALAPTMAANWS